MTRLYYRVGNETFDSYNSAVARSKSLGIPLTACYEPIYKDSEVNTKLRDKRIAKFKERAEARAN